MQEPSEIREYLKIIVELIKVLIWPGLIAILLWRFKYLIDNVVHRSNEVSVKAFGTEFKLTRTEATETLSAIFNEIESAFKKRLTADEKMLFLKILDFPKPPSVEDVLPDFKREEQQLKMLRALRGVGFINPVEGKEWTSEKHIEVTNLGKIIARYKRDILMDG